MMRIDMTGKACPIPVVEAKKALTSPETQGIIIKVDNRIAVQNLEKMASSYGYVLSYREAAGGIFEVVIQKDSDIKEYKESNQPLFEKKLVVVIGSDSLGNGEAELGKILMKAFIYSLTELDSAPLAVIFMNRGAYLTANGSNVTEDLKVLEKKGTEVLTCGTCLNYYNLSDCPEAGSIIDMYGIVERMALADSVVNL